MHSRSTSPYRTPSADGTRPSTLVVPTPSIVASLWSSSRSPKGDGAVCERYGRAVLAAAALVDSPSYADSKAEVRERSGPYWQLDQEMLRWL